MVDLSRYPQVPPGLLLEPLCLEAGAAELIAHTPKGAVKTKCKFGSLQRLIQRSHGGARERRKSNADIA